VLPTIDSVEDWYGATVLPRTVTLESMDGWIDPNHLIWSSQPLEDVNRFRWGLLRVTGSFRMDASVAVVGLFLLANLIGLMLSL